MERYKINKIYIFVSSIFAGMALFTLFLFILIIFYGIRPGDMSASTDAVITDIQRITHTTKSGHTTTTETHYNVGISYEVDGVTYFDSLSYYTPFMREGDTVKVYYNEDDPEENFSFSIISMLPMFMAVVVFMLPLFCILIHEFTKGRYINELIESGKFMLADDYAEVNSNVKVNMVRYKMLEIVCHDESGKEYKFYSRPYKPGNAPFKAGEPIKVYVDTEKNVKKYYISEI